MTQTTPPPPNPVDILILGLGWTSQFLLPLLTRHHLTHAGTSRSGHDGTIPFTFDPTSTSPEPYARLPLAKTVLVTFPLRGPGQSKALTSLYARAHDITTHKEEEEDDDDNVSTTTPSTRWIQLGSTGIFTAPHWNDSTTPPHHDPSSTPGGAAPNERAVAEDELLALRGGAACVLNLAGLYGGGEEGQRQRRPRDWVGRVARGKEEVRGKGALHLVHGNDVARAVVGVLGRWEAVGGRRWIVTDLRVYDWWDLIMSWGAGDEGMEYQRWVVELMREEGVRALPREKEGLGRLLDGRAF